MKHLPLLLSLCLACATAVHATEVLHWDRVPLAVPLIVDQERVIFVDRSVRIGMPALLNEHLRVQSAGGALYLRANAPFESTRIQLQDTDTGTLILLDVSARPSTPEQESLEPLRIVSAAAAGATPKEPAPEPAPSRRSTPIPVVLTRFAAQSLYAPLRTVETPTGIARMPLRSELALETLMPVYAVRARPLAAWRLENYWVTAVQLTHTGHDWVALDPRALQGDFVAATFQHPDLGPVGEPEDTTVLYLVTRGHGLAESLLPAISPIDPSIHLPPSAARSGARYEK